MYTCSIVGGMTDADRQSQMGCEGLDPLAPGDVVQYRHVGRARAVKPLSQGAEWGGWWRLDFITGPKRYKTLPTGYNRFWVGPRDRILR
jgi:hypothetical protein